MILGCDPGLHGALALLDPANDLIVEVHGMPLAKKTGRIDLFMLAQIFDSMAAKITYAVLEEVGAMPGQGGVSMFNFGESFGVLKGMLASHNIPVYLVRPAIWKGCLGLSRDKEDSRVMAIKLFGENLFPLKKDEGKAEAALMAYFGKRFWKQ